MWNEFAPSQADRRERARNPHLGRPLIRPWTRAPGLRGSSLPAGPATFATRTAPATCEAEREGFEPSVPCGYTRSPGVPLRPLGHLSVERQPSQKAGAGARESDLVAPPEHAGAPTAGRRLRR